MNAQPGRLLASLQAMAELFAITYWVPHLDDELEDASLFQAFLPGILRTAHLFDFVSQMPFDIRELFADRADVLNSRLRGIGKTRVIPMQLSTFAEMVPGINSLLNVVVSDDSVAPRVGEIIQGAGKDWLHLTVSPQDGAILIDHVEDRVFLEYFARVVNAQTDPRFVEWFQEFLVGTPRQWTPLSIDCPSYAHNITRPNEVALSGMGINLRGVEPMGPHAPNLYFSGSIRCARAVSSVRQRLLHGYGLPNHANDLTISVDSVAWGLSRSGIRKKLLDAGVSRGEAELVRSLVERTGYASEVRLPDATDARLALEGEVAQQVLAMRTTELRAFSSALMLHSGLRLTPIVRLNPGLNQVRPALIDLGNCARGNGPHRDFKLSKLGRRLSKSMGSLTDNRMISEIRGSANRIGELTIVADLPLEWLPIDGVPLCLRHDVSRIPCNPGNVMFAECAASDISYVAKRDLDEILVVRSFSDGDPIKRHLETALASRQAPDGRRPLVRFCDVSNAPEFVAAVSGFKGAMLIFDGHGARDAGTGVGTIIVGGRPLDVWALRRELSFPPIVLLSACDTYPIDGSHGSSAVGMLAAGARTVLGTLLPIHSIRSCSFLARLIFRISDFLPIVMARFPHGVNWRFVMSGMLRMVYASEVAYSFAASIGVSPLRFSGVLSEANMDINSRDPRWLERLYRRLATVSNLPLVKVKAYCDRYAWITDSLKYVQLGRPELIQVIEQAPSEVWASDSALLAAGSQAGINAAVQ